MEKIEIDFYESTATFFVKIDAASNKQTYSGKFKVKCVVSPLEYIYSDNLYRELIGKYNPHLVSEYVNQLCFALAQLKYRMIEFPDWFKNKSGGPDGGTIDDNILLYIYEKSAQAEQEYREGIEERYKKAHEDVKKALEDGELTDGKEKESEEEDS